MCSHHVACLKTEVQLKPSAVTDGKAVFVGARMVKILMRRGCYYAQMPE
jgi:hypothetical protein